MVQFDAKVRVVAFENLVAMCEHVSGVCHTYTVDKPDKGTVRVWHSYPDEWAGDHPVCAEYPCFADGPGPTEGEVFVILHMLNCYPGDLDDPIWDEWDVDQAWQAFDVLVECPTLWRDPNDGSWATREEIEERQNMLRKLRQDI